jgi:Tfp pilus assembly pilus retraction ATPase PilT
MKPTASMMEKAIAPMMEKAITPMMEKPARYIYEVRKSLVNWRELYILSCIHIN